MNETIFASIATAGELTRLVLKRPPLNFLNMEMLRQIHQLLESQGESPEGRALVVESEGAAFSAGLEMAEQTRDAVFLLLDEYHQVVRMLSSYPRPTIALVRGMALGAGNELAASCDFVLASRHATFGQPEIKVGTMPSLAPLLLPQRIGTQKTLKMILTGSPVDALEAERLGLVDRAVPEEAMETALQELVSGFEGTSSPVMELALRSLRSVRTRELENHLREAQSLYLNELMDLEDPTEGIQAFLEKRPPRWKNR